MLSEEGFAELYQSSWQALWCVAVSVLNDKALAEDALQESAIIALRKRGDFTPGTGFVPWMSAIVRYVALNQSRKTARSRTSSVDPALLDQTNEEAPIERRGTGSDEMFDDRVKAALETLSETARQCLLLRTIFDAPYSEIAQKLEIPEGTAMSHVHRARRTLRDRLAGSSATSEQHREANQQ